MAGVNDPVFRAICRRMGAGLTYSEMISSKGLAYKNARTKEMLAALPEDEPYAVQLFGNEAEVMADEARSLEEQLGSKLALIDINMGCPARKVASGGSGAALLDKPELAASIVAAISLAVKLPVTVKMRLLEEPGDLDGSAESKEHSFSATLAFAKLMEESGAAALTIHGRTSSQFYRGTARRDIVGLLVQHLGIPIIASGDVFSTEDVQEYLKRGASAVLAARGARGNPWIFAGRIPDLAEIVAVSSEHATRLFEWEPRKLVWMRKHLAWYFKGSPHAVRVRKAVQTAVTLEDYLSVIESAR